MVTIRDVNLQPILKQFGVGFLILYKDVIESVVYKVYDKNINVYDRQREVN